MNTALLLSGGIGSRIASEVSKQYIRAGDRMLITYALEPLLKSEYIESVEIVAEPGWREAILEDAVQAGINIGKIAGFAIPGKCRQESIRNGLEDIVCRSAGTDGLMEKMSADTIFIHDAARPFLKEELIERCFKALPGHEGVMPVLAMKDTVYRSENGTRVDGLLERKQIYAGQAPELFVLEKYYLANQVLMPEQLMKVSGSAEPAVLAGMDIVMIPGDEDNFKVTTDADMRRFLKQVKSLFEDMYSATVDSQAR